MGIKDLTRDTRTYYIDRIEKVAIDSKRRWGSMTPPQMLDHVSRVFENSLGDIPAEGNGVLPFRLAKSVVLSGVAPFPRNVLKTPKPFVANGATSVAAERARLEELIDRFLELVATQPDAKPKNPLFGALTLKEWQRLHGMHLNHHLNQFGA